MSLFRLLQTCNTLSYDRHKYWKLKRKHQPFPPNLEPWPRWQNYLDQLKHHQIKMLSHSNPTYPHHLLELPATPLILFYRGHIRHLQRPTVCIVGSRHPSTVAAKLAYSASSNLVRAGFTIVSGMARGIDSYALRGAYVSDTFFFAVAVLGTAITHCYPQENFGLFHSLSQFGLVLSEYPPWFHTQPHHFIVRNELMAALGDALLVVEAGEKSGTFHTVNAALELGRPILVFDLPAKGNQKLLQEGATPVKKVEDMFPFIFESFKYTVGTSCGGKTNYP